MKKEDLKKKLIGLLNKIKKFLKKVGIKFKIFLIKVKDKFMELPKKVRLVIYVWSVVVIAILLFMVLSSGSKNFYNKYSSFEENISAITLKYVKQKSLYATKDNKLIISLETLKEEGFIDSKDVVDETCDGISIVYFDDSKEEYVIDSYLNCDKYTSKNYWDYK